jgi:hypothetical protein
MTRRFVTVLAVCAGLLTVPLAAQANDQTPATLGQVVQKLAADGKEVREIKLRDGLYLVDIAAGEGRTRRVAIDPATLEENHQASAHRGHGLDRAPAGSLPATEIVRRLDLAGYRVITEMDLQHHHWKVHALNSAGKPVKLDVDAVTGAVSGHHHVRGKVFSPKC